MKKKNGKWGFLILCTLFLLAIWFGWLYFVAAASHFDTIAKLGQLGDSFGVLNSLFTGLAFIGVATTIFLQRRQVTLQQEQMRDDKAQIERQIFENNFYQLLSLVNQIGDTSCADINGVRYPGRYVFQGLSHLNRESYHRLLDATKLKVGSSGEKPEELKCICLSSHEFYKTNAYFTRYYQTLYQLVKFVDQSDALRSYKAKKEYVDIIRTQLSRYELFHLFFYCLDPEEEPFKVLVQKYALLKDVNFNVITDSDNETLHAQYRTYYEESAYHDRNIIDES